MNASQRIKKTFDKTLIIIDMQDHFIGHSERKLIPIICELIDYAKNNEYSIILVEFKNHGPTTNEIMVAIGQYKHYEIVIKKEEDGGPEVSRCLERNTNWSLNTIVCGIFGDACVPQTVSGMFENSPLIEIDIIADAIDPTYLSFCREKTDDERKERVITSKDILQKEETYSEQTRTDTNY